MTRRWRIWKGRHGLWWAQQHGASIQAGHRTWRAAWDWVQEVIASE